MAAEFAPQKNAVSGFAGIDGLGAGLVPVLPVPDGVPAPHDVFKRQVDGCWVDMPVVARWAYRDEQGRLLGYACRVELPGGEKDVLPQTWCRDDKGGERWRWKSLPEPRPLYGLDELAAKPGANVLVAEGEKAADAARRLLPKLAVITWPGGCKALHKADWSPLAGRKVLVWPDADAPGLHAADGVTINGRFRKGVAQLAAEAGAEAVKVVQPPDGVPEGWDAADAEADGWDTQRTMAHLRAALRDPAPHVVEEQGPDAGPGPADQEPQPEAGPGPAGQEQPPAYDDAPQGFDEFPDERTDVGGWQSMAPFRILGYDHELYYYMPREKRQVVALTPSQHSKANLITLANLGWWERTFPGRRGADWDAALNALVQASHAAGTFDPARIRGRGAWWDDGTPVLHLGDCVVVGGERRPVHDIDTRYVYEVAPPMRANFDDPLPSAEAVRLLQLCEMLNWEKPINAKLLAGWVMLAPICGALNWRPHIWLTGSSGSGKTWVMEHIVRRGVGDAGLFVQSATSEAGLRQSLGHDARPVVFDEAEGETAKARTGIETVMQLMRQASSENGAVIVKGSANGQAMSYRIRSMFAFASIGVGVQQYSDKSRVSILGLRRNNDPGAADRFAKLKAAWLETMRPEYVERLHARAFRMIPVIRANAETFAIAAAEAIGEQRIGDQVGALLAGAYALHSTREITLDEAREWVRRQDWHDEAALQEQRDEEMCLQALMEHTVRVQGANTTHDRTIGELAALAVEAAYDTEIGRTAADDALRRHGFRVTDDNKGLYVSTTHTAIKRILSDTPWVANWGRIIERLDGAEKAASAVRFTSGSRSRAVLVPLGLIVD